MAPSREARFVLTLACVSACKTHTHADAESAQFKTARALGLDMALNDVLKAGVFSEICAL